MSFSDDFIQGPTIAIFEVGEISVSGGAVLEDSEDES